MTFRRSRVDFGPQIEGRVTVSIDGRPCAVLARIGRGRACRLRDPEYPLAELRGRAWPTLGAAKKAVFLFARSRMT